MLHKNSLKVFKSIKISVFCKTNQMRKHRLKLIISTGLVLLSGMLWIFFVQKIQLDPIESQKQPQTKQFLKIEKGWSNEHLNQYVNDNLNLYFPFGISFWLKFLNYNLSPSKIELKSNETAFNLIKKIYQNRNQTVNLIIHSSHFKEGFTKSICSQTSIDQWDIDSFLNKENTIDNQKITPQNWPIYIVPNTYNIHYNISVDAFFKRMVIESSHFWNNERTNKLQQQKLTQTEAVIIASIVEKESSKVDEYINIAGVYINRYRKNMKLQADPTIVFIKGKAERVLKEDTKIDSPYNTYLYQGLPPGPICIPSIQAIDAVLNYTNHNYLYFCAKSDFSGYHDFESDYSRHLQNARQFHAALNKTN